MAGPQAAFSKGFVPWALFSPPTLSSVQLTSAGWSSRGLSVLLYVLLRYFSVSEHHVFCVYLRDYFKETTDSVNSS